MSLFKGVDMNRIYKSVFNVHTGTWVAVQETARAKGKKSNSVKASVGMALALASLAGFSGVASAGMTSTASAGDGLNNCATAATASGPDSFALGCEAVASPERATAIGVRSKAIGKESIAIGSGAIAFAYRAAAIGHLAEASGEWTTAVGQAAVASGYDGTAVGTGANAAGYESSAFGAEAYATADGATALGG